MSVGSFSNYNPTPPLPLTFFNRIILCCFCYFSPVATCRTRVFHLFAEAHRWILILFFIFYCFADAIWWFQASIHMPRIGYQDGTDRSEWYTIERLIRKYAAMFGVKIFVYVFPLPYAINDLIRLQTEVLFFQKIICYKRRNII